MIGRMIMFFVVLLYIHVPAPAFMEEFSKVIPELQPALQEDTRPSSGPESRVSDDKDRSVKAEDVMKPPDIREIVSIPKIIWSLIFIVVGYFILNILERITNLVAERQAKYRLLIKSVIPIIKIFGWIFIIFIIIAGIFQPPMATILAFAASIGVAVGFASQDILKNIFGGITILFDQPFKVGDKIESGKYYGEVIEIGLRSTRIITPDDSKVSIPNGELMNQSVSNANSGESNCQVAAEIFLPVRTNTKQVREIATEAVKVSRYVYLNKPITVLFSHIIHEEREYLKMTIKAYVLDIRDEFKFKSDIVELVLGELSSKGIIK